MNRNRSKSRPNYGVLEPKQLLAGDVTVFSDGDLFIRGDDAANQIAIVATESGQVFVRGREGTTINGSSAAFEVTDVVDLHGARDRNAAIEGRLSINMKGGHDRVDIRGLEVDGATWIATGAGNDDLRFHKSTVMETLSANMNHGHDTLRFFQTRVIGDMAAASGNGNDDILMWNSRVWNDVTINSGKGHDQVAVKRTRLTGSNHHILTSSGNDKIEIARNTIDEAGLVIEAGTGNDRVFARMVENDAVDGRVELDGQQGLDALFMNGENHFGDLFQLSGFEDNAEDIVFDRTGAFDRPGFNSDLGDNGILATILAADYFELEQTTTISSIEWRGTYALALASDVPEVDDFTIDIYENGIIDDPRLTDEPYNAPVGEPIATFDVGNDVTRTATGEFWLGEPEHGGVPEEIFVFSADVDIELQGNRRYWISIYANVDVDKTGNYDYLFRWGAETTGELNRDTSFSRLYDGLDYWFTSLYANSKFDFLLRS